MDSADDFFGLPVPDSFAPPPGRRTNTADDVANDVTFGDIGDIRAGDIASEQQWAQDHDTLAKAIEAEKEAILRRLQADQQEKQPRAHRGSSHASPPDSFQSFADSTHAPPRFFAQRAHASSSHRVEKYQTPQQRPHQMPLASSPPMQPSPLFGAHSTHPVHPSQTHSSNLLSQQHQVPGSHLKALPGMVPVPNHPGMHRNQQYMQQQQQPMYGAQQILQQQRRQQQPHIPQQPPRAPQQQLQQLLHRSPPPMDVHMLIREQQQQFVDQNRHLHPEQLRQLLAKHHQQFAAIAIARIQADQVAQMNRTVGNANLGVHSAAIPPRSSAMPPMKSQASPRRTMPPLPADALSVSELESGMRNTRISDPVQRRLSSMTDKDLEVVLRMHLRQLDTSIPYRDDFYCVIYRQRHGSGGDDANTEAAGDLYDGLSPQLRELAENSISESGGMDGERSRRKRGRSNKKGNLGRDESATRSTKHTTSNLKTLTLALGTIQSWNPKAPRRLMDLGSAQDGTIKSDAHVKHRAINDDADAELRLMRDDERVRVRAAIEEGYDLISLLHDVSRKRASHDADVLLGKLVGTLRLSSGARDDEDAFSLFERMRFFVRMCRFDKGKRYLLRVLSVLPAHHSVRVLSAVFENLSMLLFAIAPAVDSDSPDFLWAAMVAAVENPRFSPYRCLDLLVAFCGTHARDSGALIVVLTSSIGAKLLYVTMQRLFSAQSDDPTLSFTANNADWEMLSSAMTARLGDVFDAAESSKNVWEVAAMLDALSEGQTRETLRATLKELLDSGRAPPPPGT